MKAIIIVTVFLLMGCSGIPKLEVSYEHPGVANINGVLHLDSIPFSGYIVDHYENGSLKTKTPYKHGQEHGMKIAYYEDGSIRCYRNFKHGQKDGIHQGFYAGGAKKFEYRFKNGDNLGTHYDWFENGQLAKLTNFKDGKPFGEQKMWRSDGKIRSNYVIREDGRRYGLVGLKRCKNIDTVEEEIEPLTAAIYDQK